MRSPNHAAMQRVIDAAIGWMEFIPEAERSTMADQHLAKVIAAYQAAASAPQGTTREDRASDAV